MKIQFDAQQQYQLDAVSAVVDIFDGQPLEQPEYANQTLLIAPDEFSTLARHFC
jgi:restriction endonuclease